MGPGTGLARRHSGRSRHDWGKPYPAAGDTRRTRLEHQEIRFLQHEPLVPSRCDALRRRFHIGGAVAPGGSHSVDGEPSRQRARRGCHPRSGSQVLPKRPDHESKRDDPHDIRCADFLAHARSERTHCQPSELFRPSGRKRRGLVRKTQRRALQRRDGDAFSSAAKRHDE